MMGDDDWVLCLISVNGRYGFDFIDAPPDVLLTLRIPQTQRLPPTGERHLLQLLLPGRTALALPIRTTHPDPERLHRCSLPQE